VTRQEMLEGQEKVLAFGKQDSADPDLFSFFTVENCMYVCATEEGAQKIRPRQCTHYLENTLLFFVEMAEAQGWGLKIVNHKGEIGTVINMYYDATELFNPGGATC